MSVELLSKSEFGRRHGFGQSRLKRLIAEGLPIDASGKVPVAKALAWIEQNIDPARRNHWQRGSLNDLRRERERLKIATSKIELSRARGELVEREAVRRFVAERARMERDAWIAWASAASARLAVSLGVDTAALFAALLAEVRDHLRQLADKPLDGNEQQSRVA